MWLNESRWSSRGERGLITSEEEEEEETAVIMGLVTGVVSMAIFAEGSGGRVKTLQGQGVKSLSV